MITDLPLYVYLTFAIAFFTALYFFFKASKDNYFSIISILIYGMIISVFAYNGFYLAKDAFPPRIIFFLGPIILSGTLSIYYKPLNKWLKTFDVKYLTILHTIRLPIELVLFWLFLYEYIPELMTFTGRNPDVLLGITAPIIYWLVFKSKKVGKKGLLIWTSISLASLINIVTNAVLATPTILQIFAFDQPNKAVFYFPFILLPGIIVPLVLVSHIAVFLNYKKL